MWKARIGLRNGIVSGFGEDKATAVDRAKRLADGVRYVTAIPSRLRF